MIELGFYIFITFAVLLQKNGAVTGLFIGKRGAYSLKHYLHTIIEYIPVVTNRFILEDEACPGKVISYYLIGFLGLKDKRNVLYRVKTVIFERAVNDIDDVKAAHAGNDYDVSCLKLNAFKSVSDINNGTHAGR